jgi:hypothetical protein
MSFGMKFLVTFVISLMKSIDIRSENAVKLLAEFLDMDVPYVPGERHVNAEHFAHGQFHFCTSPGLCRFGFIPLYLSRNILLSTFSIQRSQRIRLCRTGTAARLSQPPCTWINRCLIQSMNPHRVYHHLRRTSLLATGNLSRHSHNLDLQICRSLPY